MEESHARFNKFWNMKKIMFTKISYVNDFSPCCLIIFDAIIININSDWVIVKLCLT